MPHSAIELPSGGSREYSAQLQNFCSAFSLTLSSIKTHSYTSLKSVWWYLGWLCLVGGGTARTPGSGFLGARCFRDARVFWFFVCLFKEQFSISHSSIYFNSWKWTRVWCIPGRFGDGGKQVGRAVWGLRGQICTAFKQLDSFLPLVAVQSLGSPQGPQPPGTQKQGSRQPPDLAAFHSK